MPDGSQSIVLLSPEETDNILLYSLERCGELTEQRTGYLIKILEVLLSRVGKVFNPLYRLEDSLETLTHGGVIVPINCPHSVAYQVHNTAAKLTLNIPEQSVELINLVLTDLCKISNDQDARKLFVACFAWAKIEDQNVRIDYMDKNGIQRDIAIQSLEKLEKLVQKSSKLTLAAYH